MVLISKKEERFVVLLSSWEGLAFCCTSPGDAALIRRGCRTQLLSHCLYEAMQSWSTVTNTKGRVLEWAEERL
jgi:hypothetical protein